MLTKRSLLLVGDWIMFSYSGVLALTAAVLSALSGLFFIVGGVWLIAVGGSWYYVIARRRIAAGDLPAAASTRGGALALCGDRDRHAGVVHKGGRIDWWPLSARGDVIFVIGLLFLLLPAHRALPFCPTIRHSWPHRAGGVASRRIRGRGRGLGHRSAHPRPVRCRTGERRQLRATYRPASGRPTDAPMQASAIRR